MTFHCTIYPEEVVVLYSQKFLASVVISGVGVLAVLTPASAAPRPFDVVAGKGTTAAGDAFDFAVSKETSTDEWVHGNGLVEWADPALGYMKFRASCLVVQGNVAIVGARVIRSENPLFPQGDMITLKAEDVSGADTLYIGLAGDIPCADPGPVGEVISTGSIVVRDL